MAKLRNGTPASSPQVEYDYNAMAPLISNGVAVFNHSNVKIPLVIEPVLRRFVVTPEMYRIYHSVDPRETNSNYGLNVPCLDRLFGTYCAEPALG
jgi:sterol desaturase/sphingolipid hydroxylase (fatty acid hydroxylase superfamily)